MTVRIVSRRGERRLVVDIYYRNPDGHLARYRHDAEVQTLQAARAEDRRRLALIATTGSPDGILVEGRPVRVEPEEEPEPEVPAAPLFRDVAKEYMAAFATSHLKPSTRLGYDHRLKGFLLNAIGDLPINEITPSKIRELDAELVGTGVKASTRASYQIVIRSILARFAVERGYLTEPPPFPKLPRSGGRIHKGLEPDELGRLLEATHSAAHRRAYLLAAYAGLRAGEIRALRWKDVDLRTCTLTVRLSRCRGFVATPKSGHERLIPLHDELARELKTKKKPDPDSLVSLTRKGKPWGEFGLRQAFHRDAERAGLEGWRFHDLRHYFVTSLFRGGAPAPAVQALAGHADLSTTQRYAHTTRADLRAAMDRLQVTVR
jgi:integrase